MSYPDGNKGKASTSSSSLPIIIGVSCSVVVVIAVIIILVVFHCKRSTSRSNNSRAGGDMPADGGSSKQEQYELKPTRSKDESILLLEEKGISKEEME